MTEGAVSEVLPVLGTVPRDGGLALPARHLGLVQAGEHPELSAFIDRAAQTISAHCDLEAITALAKPVETGPVQPLQPLGQRIAVADDRAFAFAYWHLLADWRAAGAEIRSFSPLANEAPWAAADAIFLPGGYPELHAGTLAAATGCLDGLRAAATRGALIYGECGGYMTLGDGLIDADGQRHQMAGLLRLETDFSNRQRHLGYRMLVADHGPLAGRYAGHEFHYATTKRAEGVPLFSATDATGAALPPIGLQDGTVLGSFAHIIDAAR